MKIGLIVYSNDPETVLNALELSIHALSRGDQVRVFLLGKGVEVETAGKADVYNMQTFNIAEGMRNLVEGGGQIFASGKCLAVRQVGLPGLCTSSGLSDIYEMVRDCDKVITF